MERHQSIAIAVFLAVAGFAVWRDGLHEGVLKALILAVFLVALLLYRVVAWFSGFGFWEYFATDFGSENHPAPYAFFLWLLFLIVAAFIVFDWSVY